MRPGPVQTITAETLLRAYSLGIFPMAESRDDPTIHWVDPRRRGILPIEGLHISRSLARKIRRGGYRITTNVDFAGVLAACADRPETWISGPIVELYMDLHKAGHAHSLEVWDQDRLIGGVYGVALGSAFFGESMFSRATDGSKMALVSLLSRLRAGGFTLFDTQFLTPHLASLGGVEISRERYQALLAKALIRSADFNPPGYAPDQSTGASGSTGGSVAASSGAASGIGAGSGGNAPAGTTQRKGHTS
jgi:leucyl/phenylalanyl-tRNA--protein transferase